MNDSDIRKLVQERLASGKLRRAYHADAKLKPGENPPPAIVVGSALSDPCVVCDDRETQTKYNTPSGAAAFHQRCHAIWQEEARKPIRRNDA